jgi:hypothetical protein
MLPAEQAMSGNLFQRYFDENLLSAASDALRSASPRQSLSLAAFGFSSPWELGRKGTKRGLSTETTSRFISASFLVFVEKTGR